MVSRLEHNNPKVREVLHTLIEQIISEYPKQALWLFACVTGSKNKKRKEAGSTILNIVYGFDVRPGDRLIEIVDKAIHTSTEIASAGLSLGAFCAGVCLRTSDAVCSRHISRA